jgi:WD40 repeat protein/serine/threonine protein kinase/class 3 adenylate cyclase
MENMPLPPEELLQENRRLRDEIRKLKTATVALPSGEAGTATSIEGLQTLLLRIDDTSRIRYVNSALASYLGITRETLVGEPVEVLRKFLGSEVCAALDPTGNETTSSRVAKDDQRGTVLEIRTTLKAGMLDVVIQDITHEERFKSYVQKYMPVGLDQLSEKELSTFKFPERRHMTTSFSDLRGFTAMSEKMTPEEVRSTVNAYLEEVIGCIERNGATVDKIVGDEVMALFGAPRYFEDHAFRAVKTSCDQIVAMNRLQQSFQSTGRVMPLCGIGINTGEMVLGNIGSSSRQNYTVMGTAVNLASRLCGAAAGGQVLMTEATLHAVLERLPEGWSSFKTRTATQEEAGGLRGKIEGVLPLSHELHGLTYLIGPGVATEPGAAAYRFTYLYAIKAKGIEHPVPVISVEPLQTEAVAGVELSDRTVETSTAEKIFGKYRLLQLVGRGGMGEVWKAKDAFGNTVAIKMLRAGEGASDKQIARFKREAEVMAKLPHRNICRIHEVGEVEGLSYIAMEFAEGASLAEVLELVHLDENDPRLKSIQEGSLASILEVINEGKSIQTLGVEGAEAAPAFDPEETEAEYRILPVQQTLSIIGKVCEAIQFAHEHGVLHRDLKPANIMIRPDGDPVIMDFGLAKMEHAKGESLSMSGQIVGTIEFMAPEQAESAKDLDERVDVYSVGAILYQMLTGRKYFRSSGNVLQDVQRLQTYQGRSIRKLNRAVDEDLEIITFKALRSERENRYRSMALFREDLERYRKGEVISAKAATVGEIVWKTIKRNKAVSAVTAAAVLVILAGTVFSFWSINEQRLEAVAARNEATERADELRSTLAQADYRQALGHLEAGRSRTGLAYLVRAVQLSPGPGPIRSMLASALLHRNWPVPAGSGLEQTAPVTALALDRSGRWAALGDPSGRVTVRAADGSGPVRWELNHSGAVRQLGFSPDGNVLAVVAETAEAGPVELRVWNMADGALLLGPVPWEGGLDAESFSPDSAYLAVAGPGAEARIWNLREKRVQGTPLRHDGVVLSALFSPDGSRVVTSGTDNSARVWNTADGTLAAGPFLHEGSVRLARFHPNGKKIVTEVITTNVVADSTAGGVSKVRSWTTCRIWDIERGVMLLEPWPHDGGTFTARFSPDGVLAASAGWDHRVTVWNIEDGKVVAGPFAHDDLPVKLTFSRDGRRLLVANRDRSIHVWDIPGNRAHIEPLRARGTIPEAVLSAGGNRLLTTVAENGALLWDLSLRRVEGDWVNHEAPAGADPSIQPRMGVSPDGRYVFTARGGLQIRSSADLALMASVWNAPGEAAVTSACWMPDGESVWAGRADGSVVRIGTDGKIRTTWSGHAGAVSVVRPSPDGRRIVSVSVDGAMRVRYAENGDDCYPAPPHPQGVQMAAFSPDGGTLLTASMDGVARLWKSENGEQLAVVMDHGMPLIDAVWSPDGSQLVTTAWDNTARLWNAGTGSAVGAPLAHDDVVQSIGFSRDGKKILTTSADGRVVVWDASTGRPLTDRLEAGVTGGGAVFGPDGNWLVTAGKGMIRLWDVSTGLPMGERMGTGPAWIGVEVVSDSRQLLAFSNEGRLLALPALLPGKAEELAAVGELAAAAHLNEEGVVLPLESATPRLSRALREGVHASGEWTGWFTKDPATVSLWPSSSRSVASLIPEWLRSDDAAVVERIVARDPDYAAAWTRLAELAALRGENGRAAFYRSLAEESRRSTRVP